MKRGLLVILLFFIPGVLAQSLNDASSVILKTDLKFEVPTSNKVEKLSANITYFPRSDERQSVTALEVQTVPIAEVKKDKENILIEWDSVENGVSFGINSVINNKAILKDFDETRIEVVEQYLKPTRYINSDNEKIRDLAKEIVKDETSNVKKVYKLAEWTRENINYDLSSLNVEASLPATEVLESREGVCDEITILFLALTRSMNIPSRYVSGLVYSEAFKEKWVAHAWAEVYMGGEWVPFDVTLGQFGWIDPTHLKMKVSDDVDYSSIVYNWQSVGANIFPKELKVSSETVRSELSQGKTKVLGIEPLFKEVYPGSFVPLRIDLENPTSKYSFDLITLKKGPGFFGSDLVPVLLAPNEKKSSFLMMRVPKDLPDDEEYSSKVEVKDRVNNHFSSSLLFGKKYRKISLDDAKFSIRKAEEEKKNKIPYVQGGCFPSKVAYRDGETAGIVCEIKNGGVESLEKVFVCLKEECKEISLKSGEREELTFKVSSSEKEIQVKVKFGALENNIITRLNGLSSPLLKIERLNCPEKIGNQERSKISLILKADDFVQNAYLLVEGLEPYKLKDFKGTQVITIPIRGNYFSDREGYLIVYVVYDNVESDRFETFELCNIEVTEVPFVEKVFNKIKNFMVYDIPFYSDSLR